MNHFFKRLEVIVDRLIPYCLVLLIIIILAELFAHDLVAPYHLYFEIADGIIIAIFVTDLIFKYRRAQSMPKFLKRYWIEIIALFPAFLVVRVAEEFVLLASNIDEAISLSQETLEVGERAGSKASRVHYFGRFIQPLARVPRLLKAFHFYERPKHSVFGVKL